MGILDRLLGRNTSEVKNPHPSPFTDKVTAILDRIEIKYEVEDSEIINLVLGFDEDDGTERTQLVVISATGNDNKFVTISSPVGELKEIGDKFTVEFMNQLLTDNTTCVGFGYAVETLDDKDYLVTCSDQVLASLDDTELENAIVNCASTADEMEKSLGLGDNF